MWTDLWLFLFSCWIDKIFSTVHWFNVKFYVLIELGHDKTDKMPCAPSEDSHQPVQLHSLIRVFTCTQWVAKDPRFLHADSEDWSDWADLSLIWAQRLFYWAAAQLFVSLISAVSNVATDVDLGLKEIQSLLDEETKNEEEFQVRDWPFTPNRLLSLYIGRVHMSFKGCLVNGFILDRSVFVGSTGVQLLDFCCSSVSELVCCWVLVLFHLSDESWFIRSLFWFIDE